MYTFVSVTLDEDNSLDQQNITNKRREAQVCIYDFLVGIYSFMRVLFETKTNVSHFYNKSPFLQQGGE